MGAASGGLVDFVGVLRGARIGPVGVPVGERLPLPGFQGEPLWSGFGDGYPERFASVDDALE